MTWLWYTVLSSTGVPQYGVLTEESGNAFVIKSVSGDNVQSITVNGQPVNLQTAPGYTTTALAYPGRHDVSSFPGVSQLIDGLIVGQTISIDRQGTGLNSPNATNIIKNAIASASGSQSTGNVPTTSQQIPLTNFNPVNTLQNSARIAVAGPATGIYDISKFPQMSNVNGPALAAATSRNGLLNVTRVDRSGYDKALETCAALTSYDQVQQMNKNAGVSSTDTSCGWIQYSQGGSAGMAVLGTNFAVISPIPNTATATSRYYPPLLTTSSNTVANNWANAIQCVTSGSSLRCTKELFTNPSNKYAEVDNAFETPFLQKYPMSSISPMSRDKFIQVDTNAGSMVATLYQDSERGLSDPSMETHSSYSIFKKTMSETNVQDKDSWQNAFKTIQPVINDMPRPSRDISVFATNLEEHDFCSEMNEQTIINENNLPCLQKEWIKKGGSPYDYNYPDTRLYGSCYGRVLRK